MAIIGCIFKLHNNKMDDTMQKFTKAQLLDKTTTMQPFTKTQRDALAQWAEKAEGVFQKEKSNFDARFAECPLNALNWSQDLFYAAAVQNVGECVNDWLKKDSRWSFDTAMKRATQYAMAPSTRSSMVTANLKASAERNAWAALVRDMDLNAVG